MGSRLIAAHQGSKGSKRQSPPELAAEWKEKVKSWP
jgi:hypothetical protein